MEISSRNGKQNGKQNASYYRSSGLDASGLFEGVTDIYADM